MRGAVNLEGYIDATVEEYPYAAAVSGPERNLTRAQVEYGRAKAEQDHSHSWIYWAQQMAEYEREQRLDAADGR